MQIAKAGLVLGLAAMMFCAVTCPALAYPGELTAPLPGLSRTDCQDCHAATSQQILDPGSDPILLAAVRKGPHGGYTSGSNRCQTCHALHDGPDDGR